MALIFETNLAYYTALIVGTLAIVYVLRFDWKRYGVLFLLSGVVAIGLCFMFVKFSFYSFPGIPLHSFTVPYFEMMVTFPAGVLLGVRYSPKKWIWKIPFYWGIVHIGVFLEVLIKDDTLMFRFEQGWDLWDSYTWWWIYFLVFEWIGGKIIPDQLRKPIDGEQFRYGKWGWIIFHAIVITTIFLAGYYVGRVTA